MDDRPARDSFTSQHSAVTVQTDEFIEDRNVVKSNRATCFVTTCLIVARFSMLLDYATIVFFLIYYLVYTASQIDSQIATLEIRMYFT